MGKSLNKRRVLLTSFGLGDVEDPYIYAAAPLAKWMKTECGAWAENHAEDLVYECYPSVETYGYIVRVSGILSEENYVWYMLKWGSNVKK